eukprot:Protomagalhaensia_wolfi_Nauph_80__6146@NODE_897_length_1903_cov_6_802039_g675_i0_p1_GENE_NODE_897_length_1903_cov_6_802039_g675_i0NODE_897_length_1903_cov_6_802039_g675_i0_p1_ORF_typecomplete_len519_score89_69ANTH/PF07651_16/0_098ANTH/PF07651_16/6_1e03_NODE_897_length_1903_cov_6_802039_g675_i03471873
MLDPIVLDCVYRFLWPEDRSVFLSLCKESRSWILQSRYERHHMLECLDLTLGCWRETGLGGYDFCGPSRSKKWSSEITKRHYSQYFDERITLAHLCADDTDEDPDDVTEKSKDWRPPTQTKIEKLSTTMPQLKNWLSLRVRLERQVIQCRAPDSCMVGEFRWRRLPDRQLDRISFRLRHFCPDWAKPDANFEDDEHHMYLGVYVPDTEESMESENWYIGNHVMTPSSLETLETLYEDTFDLYAQCFSFTGNPSNIFGFPKGTTKRDLYDRSTTCWTWVYLETCGPDSLTKYTGGTEKGYKGSSLVFAPFLTRLLLTQAELVDRLCDVSDESLTPAAFLREVQQFRLHSDKTLFGYDMKALLWEHSRVFKLEPEGFWDLKQHVGSDPTISRLKLDLLCSNCFESWYYATRSLGGHEKWRQHEALDWVTTEYDGLDPFHLEPVEAKLQLIQRRGYDPGRGNLAIIDMNILPEQFVPPPHDPEKGGAFAVFQVGQRAGLLFARKIEYYRNL